MKFNARCMVENITYKIQMIINIFKISILLKTTDMKYIYYIEGFLIITSTMSCKLVYPMTISVQNTIYLTSINCLSFQVGQWTLVVYIPQNAKLTSLQMIQQQCSQMFPNSLQCSKSLCASAKSACEGADFMGCMHDEECMRGTMCQQHGCMHMYSQQWVGNEEARTCII